MAIAFENWLERQEPEVLLTAEGDVVKSLLKRGALHSPEVVFWIPSAQELTDRQALRKHDLQPKLDLAGNHKLVERYTRLASECGCRIVSNIS
jgi:hypothetical protein